MDLSINISANAVAWYAAIVSTVGVIVATLNFLSDRRRVKVTAQHGFLTGVGDDSTKVMLTVANIGKRPVTASSVGFAIKGSGDVILTATPNLVLPKTLKEGTSGQTWINHDELMRVLKREKKGVEDIEYVWCRDSTGKTYKGKYRLKW